MGELCDRCKVKKPDVMPADDVKNGKKAARLCGPCWANTRPDTQLKPES